MQLKNEPRKSREVSGPAATQMCSLAPGQNERIVWSFCLALCCILQQVTSLHCGTAEMSHLLLAWNAGTILYSWFHPMLPCFLPLSLLYLEIQVLISHAVSGFPVTAPNRLNFSLLPLASPLSFILVYVQEVLKCSHPHHYLLLASQSSALPNTHSQKPTQPLTPLPFLSYSPPLQYLSHWISFLFPSLWNLP